MEWNDDLKGLLGNVGILLLNSLLVINEVNRIQKIAPQGMEKPLARLKQYAKEVENSIDVITDAFIDTMDRYEPSIDDPSM